MFGKLRVAGTEQRSGATRGKAAAGSVGKGVSAAGRSIGRTGLS
jgi:hypothetical protein